MFKFHKDLEFGFLKENEILPVIKDFFNDETIQKLDKYNTFDFKGDNKYIELKSRNNSYNKYPKTMIGYNKIKKALEVDEDVYFIFNFTDGVYYFKFDNEIDIEVKSKHISRTDRGKIEINDYAFIPIELLKEII